MSGNKATPSLHLANWNLQDFQLSFKSKMEPSVAILLQKWIVYLIYFSILKMINAEINCFQILTSLTCFVLTCLHYLTVLVWFNLTWSNLYKTILGGPDTLKNLRPKKALLQKYFCLFWPDLIQPILIHSNVISPFLTRLKWLDPTWQTPFRHPKVAHRTPSKF